MYADFWAQSGNPRDDRGVGGSVLTDPCRPAPSKGNIAMQKILGSVALALVLAVTGFQPADAQPADQNKPATGKVKVYDFSGDTIEGDLIRPEGTTVDARDFAKHSSLIRIRKDFIPEIIKSAEDL